MTAYKGAARLLANKDVLEAAAGLLATEAYHAGMVRTVLFARGLADQARKISDLRDAADGAGDLDQGIVIDGGPTSCPQMTTRWLSAGPPTRSSTSCTWEALPPASDSSRTD